MIGRTSYTRRCRECWYDAQLPLPEVTKTVIYLDQMAISNITKVIRPDVAGGRQQDPFWRDLLERLDLLCKLQRVICPDSQTHREESALAPYADSLRGVYEMFSNGATFHSSHQIRTRQLLEYLENWLGGDPRRALALDITEATHGQIHGWQPPFRVAVEGIREEDWPARVREARDQTATNMVRIHNGWRQEQDFNFERAYRRELHAVGDTVLAVHFQSVERQARILAGREPFDLDVLMGSNATDLVRAIHHRMREAGVADEDLWQRTVDFFRSDDLDSVPYLRISSHLFAAMARKASIGGQVRAPGRGAVNDVTTVSSVLPYCDAIWVDNEVAGLLGEGPLNSRIDFGTKVFSLNTRQRFLDYLDELRAAISAEHISLVREVYGEGHLHPITEVLSETS
jgi:hypothetical protein